MRTSLLLLFTLGGLALAPACGKAADTAAIKTAREAKYQTTKDHVYLQAEQALLSDFEELVVKDQTKGQLVTQWKLVERYADDTESSRATSGNPTQRGGRFFRVMVNVVPAAEGSDKLWRVAVDGEAAAYRPGLTVLQPWKHGDPEEPSWVQPRIDAMYVAIHEKLKDVALVETAPAATTAPADPAPAEKPATPPPGDPDAPPTVPPSEPAGPAPIPAPPGP